MDLKQKKITRTLQILLWIWFGVMSSFVSVSVVNIAILETENKILQNDVQSLRDMILVHEMKHH